MEGIVVMALIGVFVLLVYIGYLLQRQDPNYDFFNADEFCVVMNRDKVLYEGDYNDCLDYVNRISSRTVYKPAVFINNILVKQGEFIMYKVKMVNSVLIGQDSKIEYMVTKLLNNKVVNSYTLTIKPCSLC